jgi:hypothetical protein
VSLTRDRGLIVFECDSCGENLETGTRDFDVAVAELRFEEWLTVKRKREWLHFCSRECRDDLQQRGSR